jgi:hypothetical protein
MPLPEDLLRAALTGTPEGAPQGELLRAAAALAREAQAARVAACDPRPVPAPCPPERAPLCGPGAARALLRLLAEQHDPALGEWCLAVAGAGRLAPPEALPRLLSIGRRRPALRPFLRLVMGERGPWLAREVRNQDWRWALEAPAIPLAEALAERQANEARLLDRLRRGELLDRPLFLALRGHGVPWSAQLMQAFLPYLRATRPPTGSVTERIVPLAYFFPLEAHPMLEQVLARADPWPWHRVRSILEFRRGMLLAVRSAEG